MLGWRPQSVDGLDRVLHLELRDAASFPAFPYTPLSLAEGFALYLQRRHFSKLVPLDVSAIYFSALRACVKTLPIDSLGIR